MKYWRWKVALSNFYVLSIEMAQWSNQTEPLSHIDKASVQILPTPVPVLEEILSQNTINKNEHTLRLRLR